MKIHSVVWILSVVFMSRGAAQTSSPFDEPSSTSSLTEPSSSSEGIETAAAAPTSEPTSLSSPVSTALASDPPSFPPLSGVHNASSFATGSVVQDSSATAFASGSSYSTPSNASFGTVASFSDISKGPIIGAAVGGSVAASLVVLAGVLFCLRLRRPRTHVPLVESASDTTRRCEALEREVATLRDRLARLEARETGHSGRSPAVLYTNEKDGVALDGKVAKDRPPTYLD